jgi:hypothetical protein
MVHLVRISSILKGIKVEKAGFITLVRQAISRPASASDSGTSDRGEGKGVEGEGGGVRGKESACASPASAKDFFADTSNTMTQEERAQAYAAQRQKALHTKALNSRFVAWQVP